MNPGWKAACAAAAADVTSADEVVTGGTDVVDDVMPDWEELSDDLALLESGFFIRAAMEKSEAAWDSFRPKRVLVSPTGLDLL